MNNITIEQLTPPVSDADVGELARLLVDAVESGAAVSFVAPLALEEAEAWWRKTLKEAHPRAIFLVARDDEGIVGSVQLHPAWAPNQPHRAEITKLLVHRRRRRAGLGRRLMQAVEQAAHEAGFGLLTLDAQRGAAAEHLYREMGWVCAGTIPRFAVDPDGTTLHDAVIFYKEPRGKRRNVETSKRRNVERKGTGNREQRRRAQRRNVETREQGTGSKVESRKSKIERKRRNVETVKQRTGNSRKR